MKSLNGNKQIYLFVSFSFLLVLYGCPRKWHFSVVNIDDPKWPVFCISRYANCNGEIGFDVIDVFEVDKDGKKVKNMWILKPDSDFNIKEFKYGSVPNGWKEIVSPSPLEIGKFYSVHGAYFFRFYEQNGKINVELLSHGEFYKAASSAESVGKGR